jgi:hypothetical protein
METIEEPSLEQLAHRVVTVTERVEPLNAPRNITGGIYANDGTTNARTTGQAQSELEA